MDDSRETSLGTQSDTILTSDNTEVDGIDLFEPANDVNPSEVVRLGLARSIAEYMRSTMENIQDGSAIVSTFERHSDDGRVITTSFHFPTDSQSSSFAVLCRILDVIHEALITDTVVTKRDIFYRDVELFGSQAVVDKVLLDVTAHFGVRRRLLNVVAASKGLLKGAVLIRMKTESGVIDGGTIADEGILVPMIDGIAEICLHDTEYILIIEKEATFRSIPMSFCQEEKCLVVTGKGYPDVVTREFLKALSDSIEILATHDKKKIPIFALVDNDPHGIEILLMYKLGSIAMKDQRRNLAVPAIKWLGVRQRDWICRDNEVVVKSLLLSSRDRVKAHALLRRSLTLGKDITDVQIEVSRILMHGRKAEIQVLDEENHALFAFIKHSVAKEMEPLDETRVDSEDDYVFED